MTACMRIQLMTTLMFTSLVQVGYNNKEQHWIVRNSWGPGFGDNGYFKVRA